MTVLMKSRDWRDAGRGVNFAGRGGFGASSFWPLQETAASPFCDMYAACAQSDP